MITQGTLDLCLNKRYIDTIIIIMVAMIMIRLIQSAADIVAIIFVEPPNRSKIPTFTIRFKDPNASNSHGLIHGFGFAGILAELNLGATHLAASLLFFNVGIELGQILIVSLVFPTLIFINKRLSYKWFLPSVSTAVLFFGCIWFFQRAF